MPEAIGGYLELERFRGRLPHPGALALNSGRACLAYLLERRGIRRLLLPDLLCDSVRQVCQGVELRTYPVGPEPRFPRCGEGEWLYAVNYCGQLGGEPLRALAAETPRLIVDNAQAFFEPPLPGVDTLYSCRKFFGVPDGAFLYTGAPPAALERDVSRAWMDHLLGRFEGPAEAFRAQAAANDARPSFAVPRRMSALTENLLRAVDYGAAARARRENFLRLRRALGGRNALSPRLTEGPFAYPFWAEEGPALRERLRERRIYVPLLWPNVLREQRPGSEARRLAENVLPLPCGQRYGEAEMERLAQAVLEELGP